MIRTWEGGRLMLTVTEGGGGGKNDQKLADVSRDM